MLNHVCLKVLKQEWPERWPTFIPELIDSSQSNLSLRENNFNILRLLSEEIHDFALGRLTRAKEAALKQQLESEFSAVFTLCLDTLREATSSPLIKATLAALMRFLTWIPPKLVIESDTLDLLLNKVCAVPLRRI